MVGRRALSMDGLYMAAVFSAGEGAVIGGRSAAMVWGFMKHVSPVEVLRQSGGANQRSKVRVDGSRVWPYLLVHRTCQLPSTDIREVRGIPLTSVARTLRDMASLTSEAQFSRAFIEADRLELIDDDELQACASRTRGHRGGRVFRERVTARIPGIKRARSVLEGIYLDLHQKGVVPGAELNVPVLGKEADLVWRERSVVVELDGYEFHRGREAFENDALRGNQLKADGWSVLRVTWRMLNQRPDEVADLIVGVLEQKPIGILPK